MTSNAQGIRRQLRIDADGKMLRIKGLKRWMRAYVEVADMVIEVWMYGPDGWHIRLYPRLRQRHPVCSIFESCDTLLATWSLARERALSLVQSAMLDYVKLNRRKNPSLSDYYRQAAEEYDPKRVRFWNMLTKTD